MLLLKKFNLKLRLFRTPSDSHPELPIDPDALKPGFYKWPPHFSPTFIVIVFVGGCFGTLARYMVSLQISSNDTLWPIGTLAVNLLGAFLLGLLLEGLTRLGPDAGFRKVVRLGVGTGFMGALTTYSSLAVQLNILTEKSHSNVALLYAASSIAGGLLCTIVGIQIASRHHQRREQKK